MKKALIAFQLTSVARSCLFAVDWWLDPSTVAGQLKKCHRWSGVPYVDKWLWMVGNDHLKGKSLLHHFSMILSLYSSQTMQQLLLLSGKGKFSWSISPRVLSKTQNRCSLGPPLKTGYRESSQKCPQDKLSHICCYEPHRILNTCKKQTMINPFQTRCSKYEKKTLFLAEYVNWYLIHYSRAC